jgi:signal transduction histidine kinase
MNSTMKKAAAFGMNILYAGKAESLADEEKSRVIFLNAVTLAGAITLGTFSTISFGSGNTLLGLSCAVCALLIVMNLMAIRLFRKFKASGIFDCVIIFALYLYLAVSGGESGSGILWSMTYPLITLFLLGGLPGTIVSLAFAAAMGVILLVPALNASKFPMLYSLRVLGVYLFIWVFALIYEIVRRDAQNRIVRSNERLSKVTEELVVEKKQTDDILGGVKEGIFLLSPSLALGLSYSRHLESIFHKRNLAGANLMSLIEQAMCKEDAKAARDYLGMLFAQKVNPDLLEEINPFQDMRFLFGLGDQTVERFLSFSFHRVGENDAAYPVLAVVQDRTDQVRLKTRLAAEEKEHRRSMESLFQIIHVDPIMMREFIEDTEDEFESVNDLMKTESSSGKEILASLAQSVHAIKGNALLLGLKEFGLKVHEYEDLVKEKAKEGHGWHDLLSLTIGLSELRGELEGLKSLIGKIVSFQAQTQKSGLADTGLFQNNVEKMARKEAERQGMPIEISFQGLGKRGVPESHRRLLKDILIQFIRNSFAHGFEPLAERKARGKKAMPSINVSFEWQDSSYILRYRDDGRGLDKKKILSKAKSMSQFAASAEKLDDGALAKLIFLPGFSTAGETGLGSGRGVGMSLVATKVKSAGGRLAMNTKEGSHLEFAIRLPMPAAVSG